jgi:hypothetical protein
MSKGKTTTTASIPAYQQQQQQELFQAGKSLAGQPFVPYTGPRVAGFNPDQLRQFEATRGMFESGQQYDPMAGLQGLANAPTPTISPVTGFQGSQIQGIQGPSAAQIQNIQGPSAAQIQGIQGPSAAQIQNIQGPSAAQIQSTPTFGGTTIGQVQGPQAAQIGNVQAPQFQGLLSQDIGAYQSPYQRQVIDQSMADIQRQADLARGQSQSRAIGAGAFGGSRSALLEGESQRPFIEQMARTSAGLRESGFQQAQQAAQADLARQQQLGIFGSEQEQQRALQQAQFGQQAGLMGSEQQQQRALEQARLGQQAGLAGQDIAAQRNLQQAQLQQQAGLTGFEAQQQRAIEQARLGQQAGLTGFEAQQQRAMRQAELGQQAGLAGYQGQLSTAQRQAELGQQAGLAGYQGQLSTAQRQAELAQQAGLAGQDIQARMNMMQPELEMRNRQQQAGLLGGILGTQQQNLAALGQIGAQQQGLGQAGLQSAYEEFQRALAYGPQQFGLLAGGAGTPLVSQSQQSKIGAGDVAGFGAEMFALSKLLPLMSDERLKENITPIGKSENGHNLYTWDWNNEAKELGVDSPTIGVLAQEVMKYMPEAVIQNDDGYYMVNYGAL